MTASLGKSCLFVFDFLCVSIVKVYQFVGVLLSFYFLVFRVECGI